MGVGGRERITNMENPIFLGRVPYYKDFEKDMEAYGELYVLVINKLCVFQVKRGEQIYLVDTSHRINDRHMFADDYSIDSSIVTYIASRLEQNNENK